MTEPELPHLPELKTVEIVRMIPRRIWAEKDFCGTVTIRAQDEGHAPMAVVQINYDYAITDNATQYALTKKIMAWLGVEWDGEYGAAEFPLSDLELAAQAVREALERERAREIEWTGEDGTLHHMPLDVVIQELKRVYDAWPMGIEELEASQAAWRRVALAEREECAKACEVIEQNSAFSFGYRHGAEKCAAAIRSRK
jgi:hypothetical protein